MKNFKNNYELLRCREDKMVTEKEAKELQKLQWMKDEYIKENKRMLKIMEKQQDKVNKILKRKRKAGVRKR